MKDEYLAEDLLQEVGIMAGHITQNGNRRYSSSEAISGAGIRRDHVSDFFSSEYGPCGGGTSIFTKLI